MLCISIHLHTPKLNGLVEFLSTLNRTGHIGPIYKKKIGGTHNLDASDGRNGCMFVDYTAKYERFK